MLFAVHAILYNDRKEIGLSCVAVCWCANAGTMSMYCSFDGLDADYHDMWHEISVALDEVDLNTLDRVVAKETFDGLVASRKRVTFRIVASPAKPTPGFKSIFTYVFPCHHISCSCSAAK